MSDIFDTNAKLNKAKEGLVREFARTLTFESLFKTIEADSTVALRTNLAAQFKKSSDFRGICNDIKSRAIIMDFPSDLECTKRIKFDDTHYARLIPEHEDSFLRNEEYGFITERWHLYNYAQQIGILTPDSTDFTNEDEVFDKLANMVAQTKLNNNLGLHSRLLGYSDLGT